MSLRNKMIKQKETELANEGLGLILASPFIIAAGAILIDEIRTSIKRKINVDQYKKWFNSIPSKIDTTFKPNKNLLYLYNMLGSADEVIKNCEQMLNLKMNDRLETNYKNNNQAIKKIMDKIDLKKFAKKIVHTDLLEEDVYYFLSEDLGYEESKAEEEMIKFGESCNNDLKIVKVNGFGIMNEKIYINILFAAKLTYKANGKTYEIKYPYIEDFELNIEEKELKDIPEKELEKIYNYFNSKIIPNKNKLTDSTELNGYINITNQDEKIGPYGKIVIDRLDSDPLYCCWFAEECILRLIPSEELAKEGLELGSEGMFRNFIDMFKSEESKIEDRLKDLKLKNSCKTIMTPKALEEYINLLKTLFSNQDLSLDKLRNIKTDNLNKILGYKANVKPYFKLGQWDSDAIDIVSEDGKYWDYVNDYTYKEDGETYYYSDGVDKFNDEVKCVDIYKVPLFTTLKYNDGLKASVKLANIGILNMSDAKAWKNIKFHTLIDFEKGGEESLELITLGKEEIEEMYNILKSFTLKDFKIGLKDFDSYHKAMDKNVLGDKMFTTTNRHYVWKVIEELKKIISDFQNIIKKIMIDISSEYLNLNTEQHIEYISNLNLKDSLTTEQFNNLTKALDGLGLEYDKWDLTYSNNREDMIKNLLGNNL